MGERGTGEGRKDTNVSIHLCRLDVELDLVLLITASVGVTHEVQ